MKQLLLTAFSQNLRFAMAQPQHPDAHLPPAEVRYSVSIRWPEESEFDPPIYVNAPENCRLGVFKERLAVTMTDANQWYFPDQLVVSVDGNIRRDSDNEEIAASSAIQVDVEEEDYQDKINEFLNRIQSPEEREQYRQLLIGYSLLPHGRTETMERSYLMERFVKFLAESLRDTAQLRGPSDAMLTYVRGIIQEPEATMESVLEVLAE